jgi:hypothetical protein
MFKGNKSVAGYVQRPDVQKNPCLLAVCRRISTSLETFHVHSISAASVCRCPDFVAGTILLMTYVMFEHAFQDSRMTREEIAGGKSSHKSRHRAPETLSLNSIVFDIAESFWKDLDRALRCYIQIRGM